MGTSLRLGLQKIFILALDLGPAVSIPSIYGSLEAAVSLNYIALVF